VEVFIIIIIIEMGFINEKALEGIYSKETNSPFFGKTRQISTGFLTVHRSE